MILLGQLGLEPLLGHFLKFSQFVDTSQVDFLLEGELAPRIHHLELGITVSGSDEDEAEGIRHPSVRLVLHSIGKDDVTGLMTRQLLHQVLNADVLKGKSRVGI